MSPISGLKARCKGFFPTTSDYLYNLRFGKGFVSFITLVSKDVISIVTIAFSFLFILRDIAVLNRVIEYVTNCQHH